jgi:hypothetical protein
MVLGIRTAAVWSVHFVVLDLDFVPQTREIFVNKKLNIGHTIRGETGIDDSCLAREAIRESQVRAESLLRNQYKEDHWSDLIWSSFS